MALKSNVIDFKPAGIDQHGKKSGGSGEDGMEGRIAILEAHVSHIQSDVTEMKKDIRWMLGIFGAGFIALLITFAVGYMRLSDNQEKQSVVMSDMRVSIQQVVDAVVLKKH